MSWFSRFTRAPEPERVEPQVKSFLIGQGGFNSAFTATDKSAFELLMGRDGAVNYDQCPPLAIGINRIIRALSGLDLHYYSGSDIVASRADTLIKDYQNHRDLSELIRSIQCAGKGYCVLIGNADFMPSKIATIRPADVSEFTDQYDNTFRLLITGGRWSGTYEQVEYGSDVYRTADKLRTIILIHNQVSHAPLSPISAAMKTIIEGYNQNYRTIKNGGRLNSVWAFKNAEGIPDEEIERRRLQANARVQAGGVTVTSGDLDIKEYGLSAKDMDWANQLKRCDIEVYNLLGVPLPLVSNESATFNNYATASATFYEHTVLPLADYVFGIIGAYLAKPAKIQNAYMLADRENIDALQTKRLEQLELRKKVGVETANELRSSIYGRDDIDGGDVLLVDARLVPIDSVTGLGI